MPEPAGDMQAIIVVGASANRARYANKAVRAYLAEGYTVYPVHPSAVRVEGLAVSPSVEAVPEPAGQLLLYVRPEIGLGIIEQAPARGVRCVWINPGAGSSRLLERVRELGMEAVESCAILAIGRAPGEFPG